MLSQEIQNIQNNIKPFETIFISDEDSERELHFPYIEGTNEIIIVRCRGGNVRRHHTLKNECVNKPLIHVKKVC